jgi:hypothetical protein
MLLRQIVLVMLLSSAMLAQSPTAQSGGANQNQNTLGAGPPSGPPPRSDNGLAQMRDDLNKMESLNLNMSSEIEFLRDQNLQILLRTNSQMWTILIRDLRLQVEREEQENPGRSSPPASAPPSAKPSPRP